MRSNKKILHQVVPVLVAFIQFSVFSGCPVFAAQPMMAAASPNQQAAIAAPAATNKPAAKPAQAVVSPSNSTSLDSLQAGPLQPPSRPAASTTSAGTNTATNTTNTVANSAIVRTAQPGATNNAAATKNPVSAKNANTAVKTNTGTTAASPVSAQAPAQQAQAQQPPALNDDTAGELAAQVADVFREDLGVDPNNPDYQRLVEYARTSAGGGQDAAATRAAQAQVAAWLRAAEDAYQAAMQAALNPPYNATTRSYTITIPGLTDASGNPLTVRVTAGGGFDAPPTITYLDSNHRPVVVNPDQILQLNGQPVFQPAILPNPDGGFVPTFVIQGPPNDNRITNTPPPVTDVPRSPTTFPTVYGPIQLPQLTPPRHTHP